MILKKYSVKDQNKRSSCEDPIEDFDIIDITDQDMMVPNHERKNDVTLPTFYKVSNFGLKVEISLVFLVF